MVYKYAAGTRISPFLILSELRTMELVSDDNRSYKILQSSGHMVTDNKVSVYSTSSHSGYTELRFADFSDDRVPSGVVRMDPLRFLAGCRTRQLNQA